MAIDYRYHLATIVAIFIALLLGIMIGIGVSPNAAELNRVAASLRADYEATRDAKAEELALKEQELAESMAVNKEAVAVIIANRLKGKRVALVLDHEFPHGFDGDLRGVLTQAGADVFSTITITKNFITMPDSVRKQISRQLLLYPPPDTPLRTTLAHALARELVTVRSGLISSMESAGLVRTTSGSTFTTKPDVVLIVGGAADSAEMQPELIDLPLIAELQRFGVRVVACETSDALASCISQFKAQKVTTVDNVDRLSGRLALVFALAGAEGHFGSKETADSLLPPIQRVSN